MSEKVTKQAPPRAAGSSGSFFAPAGEQVAEPLPEMVVQRENTADPAPPPPPVSSPPPPAITPPPAGDASNPDGPSTPFQLPGASGSGLPIDWFAMGQPYFNRGIPGLRLDDRSGIEQQWLIGYNFVRNLGFGNASSVWLTNQLTPTAIDFSLSRDNPTRWETMSNEMGTSPHVLSGTLLSFKLDVNVPGDPAEREADAMAEKVTSQGAPNAGTSFFKPAATVQRSGTNAGISPQADAKVSSLLGSSGSPLEPGVKEYFESRFGHDFSDVRIHAGSDAHDAASSLMAKAFTSGTHIAFGSGQFDPGTEKGTKLLAHELTHVIQQRNGEGPVQRKIKEGPDFSVISFIDCPSDPKTALKNATEIVLNLDVLVFVEGKKITLYNVADGAIIATYPIRELALPAFYYIALPTDSFGIAVLNHVEEEENGKTVQKSKIEIVGKPQGKFSKEQEEQIKDIDTELTVPGWFGGDDKSRTDFYSRLEGKLYAIGVAPLGVGKGDGTGAGETRPPMPPWMDPYQVAIRKLMADAKAGEPGSTDLPDKFYVYYSRQFSRWRGAAEQLGTDPKKPLQVYLDIDEKDNKLATLKIIRDKIRIKQLSDPAETATPGAKPADQQISWAIRLKLEVDQLIAKERKSSGAILNLPDKTGIITPDDAPQTPYFKIWVYADVKDAEGKSSSTLKAGVLAAPLKEGMNVNELFEVVKKAALALRGIDVKPVAKDPKSYEHVLAAFPANIEGLNVREDFMTVTGGELELNMKLNITAIEGDNLFNQAAIQYAGIYYTWDVYRVKDVLSPEAYGKLPLDWKERRAALQRQIYSSGQLKEANPVINKDKLERARDLYNAQLAADGLSAVGDQEQFTVDKVLPPEKLRSFRNKGYTYGEATRLSSDATVTIPPDAGEYIVFCRAQPEPGAKVYRLPSEAFFAVKAEDGYDMAARVRDERTTQLVELKEKLKTATDDKQKDALKGQIAEIEKREAETLNVRTANQIADQGEIKRLAEKLRDQYQSGKSGEALTEVLSKDPDHEKLLQLYLMVETTDLSVKPVDKLRKMIDGIVETNKGMQKMLENLASFSGELKGYDILPAPAVGLISKVTGKAYPLLLTVGIKSTSSGGTRVILVDVTTHETQESYSGSSDKSRTEGGDDEAVHEAFADFGKKCKYGEGFIAYRVPGTGAIGRVASAPGTWQKIKSVLAAVAAVAGVAALIVGGIATGGTLWAAAAFYVGIGAAAIGAGLAADNIYDRAVNHRLELDVELVMDVINIAGPVLMAAGAMAKLSKVAALKAVLGAAETAGEAAAGEKAITTIGALSKLEKVVMLERALMVMQKGEAVTNVLLIAYKTNKDLAAVAEAYAGDPVKMRAMQTEIIKNAIISGTFALVALHNEFKIKNGDELDALVSGALKEKAYMDRMINSGLMDGNGNWTDPRIKAILEGISIKGEGGETPGAKPDPAEAPVKDEGTAPSKPLDTPANAGEGEKIKTGGEGAPASKPKPDEQPQKGEDTTAGKTAENEGGGTAGKNDMAPAPVKMVTVGGETFPEVLLPGETHTFSDGAIATRKPDGTLVITSKLGAGTGRKGYEDSMVAVGEMGLYGWVRAHSQGQGTGHENPYGILYAPAEVNEKFQNKGIEEFLRTLRNALPPEMEITLTTVTKAHEKSNRLAEIQYKVEIGKAGSSEKTLAFEASIEVSNSTKNPKVTIEATPYRIGDYMSLEVDPSTPRPAKTSEKNLGLIDPKALTVLRELNEVIANLKQKVKLGDKTAKAHLDMLQARAKELLEKPEDYLKLTMEDIDIAKASYPKDVLVTPDGRSYLTKVLAAGKSPTKVQLKELILKAGNWKELITMVESFKKPELTKKIMDFRKNIVEGIFTKFKNEAGYLGKPSTEAISDVDINMLGNKAGAHLIEAERMMLGEFGGDWSKALRLNFYTESERLTLFEQVRTSEGPEAARAFDAKLTRLSAEYNLAKMLKHAEGSPGSEARIREIIRKVMPESEIGIDSLAKNYESQGMKRRDELHLELDGKMEKYRTMDADDPARAGLAQEISLKQMEANFYTSEAYIGAGAIPVAATGSGKGLSDFQRMQSIFSNIEGMEHIIHENGGIPTDAAKEYELYKYMFRISESMYNTQLDLMFDALNKQIYRVNREGPKAMTPGQLANIYSDFMSYTVKYLIAHADLLAKPK